MGLTRCYKTEVFLHLYLYWFNEIRPCPGPRPDLNMHIQSNPTPAGLKNQIRSNPIIYTTVAAPGRQGSQVISRSLRSWGRSSGAKASAVKKPGHFEVRKSSSQVTGCNFFIEKSWRPFLVVAYKTGANAADCFTVKIREIKR